MRQVTAWTCTFEAVWRYYDDVYVVCKHRQDGIVKVGLENLLHFCSSSCVFIFLWFQLPYAGTKAASMHVHQMQSTTTCTSWCSSPALAQAKRSFKPIQRALTIREPYHWQSARHIPAQCLVGELHRQHKPHRRQLHTRVQAQVLVPTQLELEVSSRCVANIIDSLMVSRVWHCC